MIRRRRECKRPDASADVVVVGFGCAGACAAIEAAAEAEVLIVEGAPIGGGTSAAATQFAHLYPRCDMGGRLAGRITDPGDRPLAAYLGHRSHSNT